MNIKDLRQLRMKLHHARTLALEAEFIAMKEWGNNCSIATEAGHGVARLDNAVAEVDIKIAEEM